MAQPRVLSCPDDHRAHAHLVQMLVRVYAEAYDAAGGDNRGESDWMEIYSEKEGWTYLNKVSHRQRQMPLQVLPRITFSAVCTLLLIFAIVARSNE